MIYQNIVIKGKELGSGDSRKKSRFYNEGKWNNFINPLLPDDCTDMTFIEFGCNAGMYLKMAKEKGFRNVLGIEQDKRVCKLAEEYRDEAGLDYKILNEWIDEKYDFDKLPLADVILMSNLHYHLPLLTFVNLIDKIRHKTRYCIFVSLESRVINWHTPRRIRQLRRYMKDWKEIGLIKGISVEGDRSSRGEMYSVLFESKLKRKEIAEIYGIRKDQHKMFGHPSTLKDKPELRKDIRKTLMKKPILICENNEMIDGWHRVWILKEDGYKHIIARVIPK